MVDNFGHGHCFKFGHQRTQSAIGSDQRTQTLRLVVTEGLGDLTTALLTHPRGVGTVKVGRVGMTVTARALTARRALDDRAGQHRTQRLYLGQDHRPALLARHEFHHHSIPDSVT